MRQARFARSMFFQRQLKRFRARLGPWRQKVPFPLIHQVQRWQSRALFARARFTRPVHRSRFVNAYYCGTIKSGSQWLCSLLSDIEVYRHSGLVFYDFLHRMYRGREPRHRMTERPYPQPFPPHTIPGTLCIDYPSFQTIPKPDQWRAFFVTRDPRDLVVSWYFSTRNSHIINGPEMRKNRDQLQALSKEDGLLYAIDWLEDYGLFQALRSWEGGVEKAEKLKTEKLKLEDEGKGEKAEKLKTEKLKLEDEGKGEKAEKLKTEKLKAACPSKLEERRGEKLKSDDESEEGRGSRLRSESFLLRSAQRNYEGQDAGQARVESGGGGPPSLDSGAVSATLREGSPIRIVRYEDLAGPAGPEVLWDLFSFLDIQMPRSVFDRLWEAYSFQRLSGRSPGQTDNTSHLRSAQAGDWEKHFTPKVEKRFVELWGSVERKSSD